MEYLKGYTVKPSRVTETGEVLFTDGTNEVIPNQLQCQAYGYTYNNASGTCSAYRVNTNLPRNVSNINNRINGTGNTTELGTNNVQINGTNNITKGFNTNCLVNGSSNEISNGVSNATVLGSNGVARTDCEFVTSSSDGIGQYSIFFLSGRTSNAADTHLDLNGESGITTIPRLTDTLYSYTIDLVSYRTGGSSGSGGVTDRGFFRIEGMVVNANATETFTTITSKGYVTGITASTSYDVADISVIVNGIANQDLTWGATAKFYQMKI